MCEVRVLVTTGAALAAEAGSLTLGWITSVCVPLLNPSDFRRLLHLTFVNSRGKFLVVFFFKGKKAGLAKDFLQNPNEGSSNFSVK